MFKLRPLGARACARLFACVDEAKADLERGAVHKWAKVLHINILIHTSIRRLFAWTRKPLANGRRRNRRNAKERKSNRNQNEMIIKLKNSQIVQFNCVEIAFLPLRVHSPCTVQRISRSSRSTTSAVCLRFYSSLVATVAAVAIVVQLLIVVVVSHCTGSHVLVHCVSMP